MPRSKPRGRPKVHPNTYADHYAGDNERIVEFSDGQTTCGGLIALRRVDGKLLVELYRLDEDVQVNVNPAHLVNLAEVVAYAASIRDGKTIVPPPMLGQFPGGDD